MLIPIRCFTCGNVLAGKWLSYEELVRKGREARGETRTDHFVIDDVKAFLKRPDAEMKSAEGVAMDTLGLTKMCCRRHMLTTVDCLEDI
jgi:DNA-directed RNA polymerase subunit N (RpoN/RPB10)